jgi:preprotein translocase subunit SecB
MLAPINFDALYLQQKQQAQQAAADGGDTAAEAPASDTTQ